MSFCLQLFSFINSFISALPIKQSQHKTCKLLHCHNFCGKRDFPLLCSNNHWSSKSYFINPQMRGKALLFNFASGFPVLNSALVTNRLGFFSRFPSMVHSLQTVLDQSSQVFLRYVQPNSVGVCDSRISHQGERILNKLQKTLQKDLNLRLGLG